MRYTMGAAELGIGLTIAFVSLTAVSVTWLLERRRRYDWTLSSVFLGVYVIGIGMSSALVPWGSRDALAHAVILVPLITVPLGVMGYRMLPKRRSQQHQADGQPNSPRLQLVYVMIILVISLGAVGYYYARVGIPLVSVLGASDVVGSVAEARILATYTRPEGYFGQGYLEQFRVVILPLAANTLALLLARRGYGVILATLPVIVALIGAAGTGQRWPTVLVMLHFVLAAMPVRLRRLWAMFGLLGVVAIAALTALTILNGRFDAVGSLTSRAFENLLGRVFLTQSVGVDMAVEYIGLEGSLRWGSTWVNTFSSILPGPAPVSFSRELYAYRFGTWSHGNMPIPIFAEMYVNFGLVGEVVLSIWFGGILSHLDVVRRRGGRDLVEHSGWTMVCVGLIWTSLVGLGAIQNFGTLGGLLLLLGYRVLTTPSTIRGMETHRSRLRA